MADLSLFDLTDKTVLITGGSQGIGLSLAVGLAKAGANVVINGRDKTKLKNAVAFIHQSVGEDSKKLEIQSLAFDVTDNNAVSEAISGYESEQGRIDVLINNAGIQHRGPLENFSAIDFTRVMETNVNSVFYVSQAVAKHMIPRQQGKIINIASVQSALARPSIAPYTASKGAVSNLTKGMTTDWAKYGLQINAIAPGYFATPMNEALVKDKEFSDWLQKRTPAGRWGNVEELIGAAIFLSSDASSFVNGITLFVDGGMTSCV